MKIRSIKRKAPKVHIPQEVWDDFMHITALVDKEVGWLTRVVRAEDETFTLYEVHLPEQESHSATVEFQPEHIGAYFESLMPSMSAEELAELNNSLRCWCHSHNNMGVSPSSQDQTTVEKLVDLSGEYFVAVRVNKRGEVEADVAYPDLVYEGVSVTVGQVDTERRAHWKALVDERVKAFTYASPKGKGKGKKNELVRAASYYDPFGRDGYYEHIGVPDSVKKVEERLRKATKQTKERVLSEWMEGAAALWPDLVDEAMRGVAGADRRLAATCYSALSQTEEDEAVALIRYYRYDGLLGLVDAGWEPGAGWKRAYSRYQGEQKVKKVLAS